MSKFSQLLRTFFLTGLFMVMTFSANAENLQLKREFINNWQKGMVTLGSLADATTRITTFDNDEISCSIRPSFAFQPIYGSLKQRDNIIYGTVHILFASENLQLTSTGVEITIYNKTQNVITIDPNKSLISIGTYNGRPVPGGTQFNEQQSAILPPIVVAPLSSVTKNFYRGDFQFINSGTARWECPSDLYLSQNIFGSGSFILAVENPQLKYIPMVFYMKFTKESIGSNAK